MNSAMNCGYPTVCGFVITNVSQECWPEDVGDVFL